MKDAICGFATDDGCIPVIKRNAGAVIIDCAGCPSRAMGNCLVDKMDDVEVLVSLNTTPEEQALITQICSRAMHLGLVDKDVLDLSMDLSATHANGNPLDFQALMDFDDGNFAHDINGIQACIDRSDGQLTHCFSPRCSK